MLLLLLVSGKHCVRLFVGEDRNTTLYISTWTLCVCVSVIVLFDDNKKKMNE